MQLCKAGGDDDDYPIQGEMHMEPGMPMVCMSRPPKKCTLTMLQVKNCLQSLMPYPLITPVMPYSWLEQPIPWTICPMIKFSWLSTYGFLHPLPIRPFLGQSRHGDTRYADCQHNQLVARIEFAAFIRVKQIWGFWRLADNFVYKNIWLIAVEVIIPWWCNQEQPMILTFTDIWV